MRIAVIPGGPLGEAVRNGKKVVALGDYVKTSMRKALEEHKKNPFDFFLCLGGSGMVIPSYKDSASNIYNVESLVVSVTTSDSFFVQSFDPITKRHSQAYAMKCWLVGMSRGEISSDQVVALGQSMNTIDNILVDFWPWAQSHNDSKYYFICSKPHWRRIKLTLKRLVGDTISDCSRFSKSKKFFVFVSFQLWESFNFIDCGYKEPLGEWLVDTAMYFLTIFDPLGERWPLKQMLEGRKEKRLKTGR